MDVPQIDDTPHVGAEPRGGAAVRLVFADENRVRHGEQTDKCPVLQEFQNLTLVG